MIKTQVLGVKKMLQKAEALKEKMHKAQKAAVYQMANNIIGDAKEKCPVDTGTLKGSGYVAKPEGEKDNVSSEIGFGGAASEYALRQHETHKTKSKFLERAVMEHQKDYVQNMQALIKENFKP